MNLLPPLLLGLAGSLHCVGMCGPLLLALPLDGRAKLHVFSRMLIYHSGRVLSYTFLGILFGLIGKAFVLAGLQKALSLVAGIFFVVLALGLWRSERILSVVPGFRDFTNRVKTAIGRRLRERPDSSYFSIGLFNGLLPCGLVYTALAGAIAMGGSVEGGAFMLFFGLGTLPLLLAATFLGRSVGMSLRKSIRYAQPVLLVLAGLVLIQRGLHLDLSLFESAVPKAGLDCH